VILEAVATNLPIIATDLPGVREIADHTNPISIVPVKNRDALANEISKRIDAVTDRPLASSPFPPEFDLHNCAEKLFEVYCGQLN
jgi:glycosyltransferase involved in cell wall biosynthesis